MESMELSGKEKKVTRKEILEKKKAMQEILKAAAYPRKDHLSSFPGFRQYRRNGLSIYLESGRGNNLSSSVKLYIQNLLKANMKGPYGSEWPAQEKVKRRELSSPEAHYIFVQEETHKNPEMEKECTHGVNGRGMIVGFVQYRFVIEVEILVLYVYELQLEPHVRRKGLGEFLMELIELIAHKSKMGAVALTVQKANLSAMDFYMKKLSGVCMIACRPKSESATQMWKPQCSLQIQDFYHFPIKS